MSNNLFPSLGDIAQRTDAMKDVDDNDARLAEDAPGQYEQQEGEEKEMQEIESMCMRCHDNVCDASLLLRTVGHGYEGTWDAHQIHHSIGR